MKPEELDSVIDSLESLRRIADAFLRDTSALADVLKRIQHRGVAAEHKGDIFAYDEQIARLLPHYGIPAGGVRESLHETLLTNYAALHSIPATDLAQLLTKMRTAGREVTHLTPSEPTPSKAAEAFIMDSGPTPTPLQESLLQLTDSMARRAAVPKPIGEQVAQYFSAAVVRVGRGFLRPGVSELQSYSESVFSATPGKAQNWPDGFYDQKNAGTTPGQFFCKTPNWLVVIKDLFGDTATVWACTREQIIGDTEFVPMDSWSRGENLAISGELEILFEALSSKAV